MVRKFPDPERTTLRFIACPTSALLLSTDVSILKLPTAPVKSAALPTSGSGFTLIDSGSVLRNTVCWVPSEKKPPLLVLTTRAKVEVGIGMVPAVVGNSACFLIVYSVYCLPLRLRPCGMGFFGSSTSSTQNPFKVGLSLISTWAIGSCVKIL